MLSTPPRKANYQILPAAPKKARYTAKSNDTVPRINYISPYDHTSVYTRSEHQSTRSEHPSHVHAHPYVHPQVYDSEPRTPNRLISTPINILHAPNKIRNDRNFVINSNICKNLFSAPSENTSNMPMPELMPILHSDINKLECSLGFECPIYMNFIEFVNRRTDTMPDQHHVYNMVHREKNNAMIVCKHTSDCWHYQNYIANKANEGDYVHCKVYRH